MGRSALVANEVSWQRNCDRLYNVRFFREPSQGLLEDCEQLKLKMGANVQSFPIVFQVHIAYGACISNGQD